MPNAALRKGGKTQELARRRGRGDGPWGSPGGPDPRLQQPRRAAQVPGCPLAQEDRVPLQGGVPPWPWPRRQGESPAAGRLLPLQNFPVEVLSGSRFPWNFHESRVVLDI